MTTRYAAFSGIALAAVLAACGGTGHALVPSPGGAPAAAGVGSNAAGRVPLSVTLKIARPVLNASRLVLYAYPLGAAGPLASPPAASMVANVAVANGSPGCTGTNGRTCTVTANVPPGTDAVVAQLSTGNAVVGRAFAVVGATGTTAPSLALVAGRPAVASLSLSVPLAIARNRFAVGVNAVAANGSTILVDPATPVTVTVYGPARVVPHPVATVGGSGATASFTSGSTSFANPMTVAAIVGTMSNTAQIFPRATVPLACAPLGATTVYRVAQRNTYVQGFHIGVSVAGSDPVTAAIDTGSTSFLIARAKLTNAQAGQLIGPGQAAAQHYVPSNIELFGNYYLAPVTLYDGSRKLGTTVPMEVFVTDRVCNPKSRPHCVRDTTTSYMGVGYGRPSPNPSLQPGLLVGPLESAFAQLSNVVQGSMHPGFGLTPKMLTIGINNATASGYRMEALQPYPSRNGDWSGPRACLRFNTDAYQCGHMLLDIGINTMIVNGTQTPSPLTRIEVVSPSNERPLLEYAFPYPVRANATPPAPNPGAGTPVLFDDTADAPFVNTGRDALAAATYLYDAGCGKAGFKAP